MRIRSFPPRKLEHLVFRSVIPTPDIKLRVSSLGCCEWDRYSPGSTCFSRYQLGVPLTSEGTLSEQRHPKVCSDVITLLALVHVAPVAMRANMDASPRGAQDDTEKFGPLKVVLEAIPALYANREVRLTHRTQHSPLTKTLPGNRYCEQQDQNPPFARSRIGGTIQLAPK